MASKNDITIKRRLFGIAKSDRDIFAQFEEHGTSNVKVPGLNPGWSR